MSLEKYLISEKQRDLPSEEGWTREE